MCKCQVLVLVMVLGNLRVIKGDKWVQQEGGGGEGGQPGGRDVEGGHDIKVRPYLGAFARV